MNKLILILLIFSIIPLVGCSSVSKIDIKKKADITYKSIDEGWESFNTEVDRFFTRKDFKEEINESYILLSHTSNITDKEGYADFFTFKIRTDFPNASKDFNLILQNEGNELTEGQRPGDRSLYNPVGSQRGGQGQVSAAGRYNTFLSKKWKTSVDLGFKFMVPLNPFVKYRIKRRFKFKNARLNFTQLFKYFRIESLEHDTALDFIYRFKRRNYFKNQNLFSYKREDKFYTFYNSLAWQRRLPRYKLLSLTATAQGTSEPVYTYEVYTASVGLRQRFYKNWMHIEPVVGLKFPKEGRFHRRGFILLTWDAKF